MTSFSISWWVELRIRIKYWFEIDIRLSQNVEIKYLSQVRRLILSTWVKSEDWYWVLESSQKIDIKTQLDDQFIHKLFHSQLYLNRNSFVSENSYWSRTKSLRLSRKYWNSRWISSWIVILFSRSACNCSRFLVRVQHLD